MSEVVVAHQDGHTESAHKDLYNRTLFGFWVYIMSDCVLFASLFATFAVLHNNTYGGPGAKQLFELHEALAETLILLTSSFTCGLAVLAANRHDLVRVFIYLILTFLLGASFLGIELNEFHRLVTEGNSWERSAFLSSFFTLVGTHGAHITVGLIWTLVLFAQLGVKGLTFNTYRRLACFSLFWHFLDVVWIFIFTFVYLMEVK